MAKLTAEYIRREFYRQFAALKPEQQLGVIEGLRTVHECGQPQQALPLEVKREGEDATDAA